MQQHLVITAMLGGLLGTLGQMLLVYGVAPLMAGHTLDLAALRGCSCASGLLLHLLSGSVLWPLGLLSLPAHAMPSPPMLRGMLYAVCLWVALENLVAPRLGAGVFSMALGGVPAALRALLGSLVYGATLGGIAVAPSARGPGDGTIPVRRPQGGPHRWCSPR